MSAPSFEPFAQKMRQEKLPEIAIQTFAFYYDKLVAGESGLIAEDEIEPVDGLPHADELGEALTAVGQAALSRTVMIKLNGGLGTSMGLSQAKSLLPVRDGYSFLDIIARQALENTVPLVLMNSFNTQADSLAALEPYPALRDNGLPLDFVQHKIPKVDQETLAPAQYPADPDLEWCPPGHGDLYTALITSGMLDRLLAAGYEIAFVSNSDNLGAVLDTGILGHFVANDLPFLMEVCTRTESDKKGGHLARLKNGQLILRESAQTAVEDVDDFQDITRHRFFNTNSLWINLRRLKEVMAANSNILGLPMIRNAKTVNPRDKDSRPVFQLETAMGSAIATFPGAGAIEVPRQRFAPVKTTNDLLAVRSDCYQLTDSWRVLPNPARTLPGIVIQLDPTYYKLTDEMEKRFPFGPPSLLQCERFTVAGDVTFGKDVVATGVVQISHNGTAPHFVSDGSHLGQTDAA